MIDEKRAQRVNVRKHCFAVFGLVLTGITVAYICVTPGLRISCLFVMPFLFLGYRLVRYEHAYHTSTTDEREDTL